MLRRAGVLLVLVGAALGAAACTPVAAPPPAAGTPASAPASGWEAEMLARINAERANAGAAPLANCGTLRNAAIFHSADQAARNTMTHNGADGSTIAVRADRAGYTGWTSLGENVAYGYSTVDSVMNGWMNSPGHRANLLSTSFTHVGLGRVSNGGPVYWTQDFGRSGSC